MNKLDEEFILSEFKDRYMFFPKGEVRHIDKPDFIVIGEQIIGIEITQVFIDQELDNGSLIKAKKTFHRYLLSNVVDELKLHDFPKCIIAVHLKDKFYSKDLNPKIIGKICADDILLNASRLIDEGDYEFCNFKKLPSIIDGYTISILNGLQEIEYAQTGSAVGIPISNSHIQFILDKKEIAKKKYKECNTYWLLIREGTQEADYFGSSVIENASLQTTFDKVFLFRQRNSEIIELK